MDTIKDINTDSDVLITYNNGADIITTQDIYNALRETAFKYGYENIDDISDNKKCSSARFCVMLKDIGNIFKSTKALITTTPGDISGAGIWEYDKYKLLSLINIYGDICYIYNKRCSISGFLNFCGIGNTNYLTYREKQPLLSENLRARIAERLNEKDDEHQKDRARDSEQPILQLAYNNYVHGWNGEIRRKEITSTIKTLDDIKNARLELSAQDTQNEI